MLKNIVLSAAALVLTAGLSGPASAAAPMAPKAATVAPENASVIEVGRRHCRRCGDRGGRHYYRRGRDRSSFSLNFSFGSPGYYHAPHYYAPRVVYYKPWTPAWYTYCKTKYRSFNRHTGYYMTHSSGWKLCH